MNTKEVAYIERGFNSAIDKVILFLKHSGIGFTYSLGEDSASHKYYEITLEPRYIVKKDLWMEEDAGGSEYSFLANRNLVDLKEMEKSEIKLYLKFFLSEEAVTVENNLPSIYPNPGSGYLKTLMTGEDYVEFPLQNIRENFNKTLIGWLSRLKPYLFTEQELNAIVSG
jgi:hypothetical protein